MGKIICAVSGKGGTGKSTFSCGVALALAKKGCNVLLVDMDLGLRSLDIMLGVENKVVFDIGDILDEKCKFENAIVKHRVYSCLKLLCSPINITKPFHIPSVIDLIQKHKREFDYIILDLPAGLGLSVIMAKSLADLVCVITTPDIVTVRDARKICDVISENCKTEYKVVINKVSKKALRTSNLTDLDQVLEDVAAPLLGVLSDDEWIINVFGHNGHQKKSSLQTDKAFEAIAKRIEGKYVPLVIKAI